MQYVFLKRYTQCTMGSGAKPQQKLGIFENFCVKSNFTLTACKVTYDCKLQKKIGGAGCSLLAPPIILLGEQLLPRAYA